MAVLDGRLSRLMRRAQPGDLLDAIVLVADPPVDYNAYETLVQGWRAEDLSFIVRQIMPRVGIIFIQADTAALEQFLTLPQIAYLSATTPDVFPLF